MGLLGKNIPCGLVGLSVLYPSAFDVGHYISCIRVHIGHSELHTLLLFYNCQMIMNKLAYGFYIILPWFRIAVRTRQAGYIVDIYIYIYTNCDVLDRGKERVINMRV